ncbi:MAG: VOC family protein [Oscillatoriaceae cyanobacterium Prado104]|jgi:catechol 2,3-dioxygenase-like lactoylglutathione lyase family enzyme|nr:VOC family protein [Oscillatoriaceae cyanobacterium Prado104]
MQILQSLHAALLVSNLEQSEHFYSNVLGLSKIERDLKFSGIWYQVGNFQIHLILAEKIAPDAADSKKWGRNRHLAFSVADLEAAKQQLIAYNCPIQMSASGRAALFVRDPDGNTIELSDLRFEIGN